MKNVANGSRSTSKPHPQRSNDISSSCRQLHAEWQKRVALVAGLEDQVIQLRDNYQQREASLVAERDQALQQARWVGLMDHMI